MFKLAETMGSRTPNNNFISMEVSAGMKSSCMPQIILIKQILFWSTQCFGKLYSNQEIWSFQMRKYQYQTKINFWSSNVDAT